MSLDRFWNDSLEVTVGFPKTAAWAAYCSLKGLTFPKELNQRIDKLGRMGPKIVFLGTEITFLGSVFAGAAYILLHKDNGPDVSPTKSPAGHVVPPIATPTLRRTDAFATQILMTPIPKPPTVSGGNGDNAGDGKGKGGNGDDDKKPPTEKSPDPKVTASRTPTSISAAQTRAAAEASATRAATQQATADNTPAKPATQARSEMPDLPPNYKDFGFRPYSSQDIILKFNNQIDLRIPGAEAHTGGFWAVNLGENLWGFKHKNGKVVVITLPYVPDPRAPGKCTPKIGERYFVPTLAITKITDPEAVEKKLSEWLGGGSPPPIEPKDLSIYPSISSGVYTEFVELKGAIAFYCYPEIVK